MLSARRLSCQCSLWESLRERFIRGHSTWHWKITRWVWFNMPPTVLFLFSWYLLDATRLDKWVFESLRTLFYNATADNVLNGRLCAKKTVFFLHLPGLDNTGHSYRPHSKVCGLVFRHIPCAHVHSFCLGIHEEHPSRRHDCQPDGGAFPAVLSRR